MNALPIDPFLPQAVQALMQRGALVLTAEPGAGKTTRFPWAAVEGGAAGDGEAIVLEPRRLAARMAAKRICDERGLRLGERVGYQVRFEEVAGPKTRIRVVTEGILTRRLVADPLLRGVGLVILDEFHERHLQGDLSLALLVHLKATRRPDLRIVVMSATLDVEPLRVFLGDCPTLSVPGRRFEVSIDHLERPDARPLEQQVAGAVKRAWAAGSAGHILVFLPGAREIRLARDACADVATSKQLRVVALHGELSPEEQDAAVASSSQPKVILSTNVAESSLTIDGVTTVIDSGLVRQASFSTWSGHPSLRVVRTSKASAIQRAGRAGRTAPGRCLRLYTLLDFQARPDHDPPEIGRSDLADLQLALHGLGVGTPGALAWLEAPPPAGVTAAEQLLRRLGATTEQGDLAELGRAMLAIPAHPRQARVLLEARARGVGRSGALLAAILGEGDFRLTGVLSRSSNLASLSASSDLLELMDLFEQARRCDFDPAVLRNLAIHPSAVRAVDRSRKQLEPHGRSMATRPQTHADDALRISVLAGYPDRVARRRSIESKAPGSGDPELLMSGGGSARLSDRSVVRDAKFMVAAEIEERSSGRGAVAGNNSPMVTLASAIEPDWLLDLYPHAVVSTTELRWNPDLERVEATGRLLYESIAIEESPETRIDPTAAAELLAKAALQKGLGAFVEGELLERLTSRMRFLSQHAPDLGIAPPTDEELRAILVGVCADRSSFAELRNAPIAEALRANVGRHATELEVLAPETLKLPGGRTLTIHYEAGKEPWAESFLQDFFGMKVGPTVAQGRVPVVLHLLAPNRRAVQVTTDLSGFWERHYPSIKKELSRRYPRHSWPSDPRNAQPPPPRGRR